ncbi:MAG: radical SAM protein, partial [Deltaproteobacteria bacterium]
PDYPEKAKVAIREMYRQVGDLLIENGIATRGLLVRHLVMPNGLAGTNEIMKFLSNEISENTYVNIMPQYRPCGAVFNHKDLSRPISEREFKYANKIAKQSGIWRFD